MAETGPSPTAYVPCNVPSVPSLITLLLPKLATHRLAPSKAMPKGPSPTLKVETTTPFDARSFVTVSLLLFVT